MVISFGENSLSELQQLLDQQFAHAKRFILVDSNTSAHCLPILLDQCAGLEHAEILEVPEGEESKSIAIVQQLWGALLELQADRDSIVINLGGGVITDLGGFVAATLKRGIPFVHVPTSLLAMTDAAYGGKTGINFEGLKNQIGTFTLPVGIFYYPAFLATLPKKHMRAGTAEMIKHGLIADASLFQQLQSAIAGKPHDFEVLLEQSQRIKTAVVSSDLQEKGERKKLNFGHTFGHAFESLYATYKNDLLHGDAVAAGMIIETYLSHQKAGLTREKCDTITKFLLQNFPKVTFAKEDYPTLLGFMAHDKKRTATQIEMPLLTDIGTSQLYNSLTAADLEIGLDFYQSLL